VITKDSLEGNLDKKMYIRQIKLVNPNSKIILIVESLETEYKSFLFANEVFSILESKSLKIENIINCIEEDNKVIYKNSYNENLESVNESLLEYKIKVKNQVLSKKKIAIYGTSGAGKSLISSILSRKISTDLKISLALLDMDMQNPSIDIFNNIDENIDGLTQMIDDLDKRKNVNDIIDKYMIKDKNNKNLWYMTNNVSIFDMQNKLSNSYYEKIYTSMLNNFDFTMIDLPSSPFLDVVPYTLKDCDNIFFVVNPNYASIRQALKYLDLLTKLWSIPKDKIKLIINKVQKNSLENVQIENLLENYEIVLNVPYIKDIDSYINGAISDLNLDFNMKRVYKSIGIKDIDVKESNLLNIKSILKKVGVKNDCESF
jgi:MinD-like ATPase involved in chromosome partitioning or flagellar assembly